MYTLIFKLQVLKKVTQSLVKTKVGTDKIHIFTSIPNNAVCYVCMFIPVSVEELSPGSLCDLKRGKNPSLSFRSRPICSRKHGLRRSSSGVWSVRSSAGPDRAVVGGLKNADEESRREGVQGRTRISGIKECWDPAKNSNWEQLLANRAWRLSNGDLWRK